MKLLLTIMLLGAVAIAGACGGGDGKASSTSHASATSTSATTTTSNASTAQETTKADRDKDNDPSTYDDTNNASSLDYGHAASAADAQAVTALVKRYYATALAGDGTKACSMITSSLAEAIVEDFGHGSAGPSYLKTGTTCPAVMTLLFKHEHSLLVPEFAHLQVTRVRLIGHRGLAILRFGTLPERQIPVAREGHTWKIPGLLDTELP